MDWGALIKIAASIGVSIVKVATARRAIDKLKRHIAEYREITAPQPARPNLQLGFQWVGDLRLNMIHPPGNRFSYRESSKQNPLPQQNPVERSCLPVALGCQRLGRFMTNDSTGSRAFIQVRP